MFGFVSRSRLLDAERRIVKLRIALHKARDERQKAEEQARLFEAELAGERKLREAAEAERDRLLNIIEAAPAGPETPSARPARPASEAPEEMPRILTGLEVVARATRHRNVHNQASRR